MASSRKARLYGGMDAEGTPHRAAAEADRRGGRGLWRGRLPRRDGQGDLRGRRADRALFLRVLRQQRGPADRRLRPCRRPLARGDDRRRGGCRRRRGSKAARRADAVFHPAEAAPEARARSSCWKSPASARRSMPSSSTPDVCSATSWCRRGAIRNAADNAATAALLSIGMVGAVISIALRWVSRQYPQPIEDVVAIAASFCRVALNETDHRVG